MRAARRRFVLACGALALPRARAQATNAAPAPRWLRMTICTDRPEISAGRPRSAHSATVADSRDAGASMPQDGSFIVRAVASSQSMRMLDGSAVRLMFETAVPMTFRRYQIGAGGITEVRGSVHYDALMRFLVRPRVTGSAVAVDIEPDDATLLASPGERARLAATAQGRLGEWIGVGGTESRDTGSDASPPAGTYSAQTRTTTAQRGVWLKVELDEASGR